MASPHDIADELRSLIAEAREVVGDIRAAAKEATRTKRDIELLLQSDIPRRVESVMETEVNKQISEFNDFMDAQVNKSAKNVIRVFQGIALQGAQAILEGKTDIPGEIVRTNKNDGTMSVVKISDLKDTE